MKVLVSGGTGLVGRYVVEGLLAAGYDVMAGGRCPPPDGWFSRPVRFLPLSLDPDLNQIDAFDEAYFFVHAAFNHLPGKYRGGEGEDPDGFRRLNLDGTVKLFETAKKAGTRRAVFLSSRAVYDGTAAGTLLTEDLALEPDSLYGEVKLFAETALAALSAPGFSTASLRLTGVYGGMHPNKWDGLFADHLASRPVPSRAGTEVHGRDVAAAVRLMLEIESGKVDGQAFNVSDILTDTREILSYLPGQRLDLPRPADRSRVNRMATERIRGLGWRPGGEALFRETMHDIADGFSAAA